MSQERIVDPGENAEGGGITEHGGRDLPYTCRVITDYQMSSQDPLAVAAGETVQVSDRSDLWHNNPAWVWIWCTDPRGKSGWVPLNLLDSQGGSTTAIARYTYSAAELTVSVGETLTVNRLESGWAWCTNQQGTNGWVPLAHIEYT